MKIFDKTVVTNHWSPTENQGGFNRTTILNKILWPNISYPLLISWILTESQMNNSFYSILPTLIYCFFSHIQWKKDEKEKIELEEKNIILLKQNKELSNKFKSTLSTFKSIVPSLSRLSQNFSQQLNQLNVLWSLLISQDNRNKEWHNITTNAIENISSNSYSIVYLLNNLIDKISQIISSSEKSLSKSSEVNGSINNLADNLNSISILSKQVHEDTIKLVSNMSSLMNILNNIKQSSHQSNEEIDWTLIPQQNHIKNQMNKLLEIISQVNKFIQKINEISKETNLVAINAWIEASRAWEIGKWFAVIACDVKVLALEVKKLSADISQLLRSAKEQASSVQKAIEGSEHTTSKLSEHTNNTNEYINEMHKKFNEMLNTLKEDIKQAIELINSNISNSTEQINQISKNSDQINNNAQIIVDLSKNFANVLSWVIDSINIFHENNTRINTQLESSLNDSVITWVCLDMTKEWTDTTLWNVDRFNMLIQTILDSANEFDTSLSTIDLPFNIIKIKNDHLIWLWNLWHSLNDNKDISVEEIINHKDCDLWKWYTNVKEKFSNNRYYIILWSIHKKIHFLGKEIIILYQDWKINEAREKMNNFFSLRKKLFNALDNLYLDIIKQNIEKSKND